jgi:hypothetical protein
MRFFQYINAHTLVHGMRVDSSVETIHTQNSTKEIKQ